MIQIIVGENFKIQNFKYFSYFLCIRTNHIRMIGQGHKERFNVNKLEKDKNQALNLKWMEINASEYERILVFLNLLSQN